MRQGYGLGGVSFGRGLTLFFVVVGLVPVVAVIGLLVQVTGQSRAAEADARLAGAVETALAVEERQRAAAMPAARRIAAAPDVSAALRGSDAAALSARVRRAASQPRIEAAAVEGAGVGTVTSPGFAAGVAFGTVVIEEDGRDLGSVAISTTSAEELVAELSHLTGRDVAVLRGGEELAGTFEVPTIWDLAEGTVDVDARGQRQRARAVELGGPGEPLVLIVLSPVEAGFLPPVRLANAALFIAFLALAIAFSLVLARALGRVHELVAEQAETDGLTGLSNHRRFQELLRKEVERARRFDHPLGLLMIDIDDFKQINDQHGHQRGDDVLRELAHKIDAETRDIDEAARYGGEEFAVILPQTDAGGAIEVAERMRRQIADSAVALRGKGRVKVTVSIGAAAIPGSASDGASLVGAADAALYRAKRGGKNRCREAGGARRSTKRRRRNSAKGSG